MELPNQYSEALDIAPDLDPEALAASLELAQTVSHVQLDALRYVLGERIDYMRISRSTPSRYVVRDAETGLYLKAHPSMHDANTQRNVMNALNERLDQADIGVQAVRHLAVVRTGKGVPVSVIEPAGGLPIRHRDKSVDALQSEVGTVRERLVRELGAFVADTLVNDIIRFRNVGGNVFRQEDGSYTIIDQPFLQGPVSPRVSLALRLLRRSNSNSD